MTHSRDELINNKGLILQLGVVCKDYCVIPEIDEFFLYAGADKAWRKDIRPISGSQRMHRVGEWVAGLKQEASSTESSEILRKVVGFILNGKQISGVEADFLRSEITIYDNQPAVLSSQKTVFPDSDDQMLARLIGGLHRATYPFKNRRQGKTAIRFTDEYDLQDLFHTLLRPWVGDIRPEEYTPSYAGSSTRIDFLLREHKIVCELKFVHSASHAKKVGGELTIDIAHYRQHPNCETLYAVIYDPNEYIANPDGLVSDLESNTENPTVKVFILPTRTLS